MRTPLFARGRTDDRAPPYDAGIRGRSPPPAPRRNRSSARAGPRSRGGADVQGRRRCERDRPRS
ncbi:MAG: hypothetical protein EOO76_03090 [Novosphingobium sp.]|nr:MAG: hypothetical protein EOO76_03090 [Novosphingobium sp.]